MHFQTIQYLYCFWFSKVELLISWKIFYCEYFLAIGYNNVYSYYSLVDLYSLKTYIASRNSKENMLGGNKYINVYSVLFFRCF